MSGAELIVPDWPAPANVHALATTRSGGLSCGAYAELNLGDHVGDDPAVVAANRGKLIDIAQLPAEPCWLNQVHDVQGVQAGVATAGATSDWSWSAASDAVCVVMTADCLPLLICDRAGSQVAAVHAGWRGLCAGVVEQSIRSFVLNGIPPEDLLVWLGPAIGAAAYEVDAAVYAAFAARTPACGDAFVSTGPEHWQFDLYAAARKILNGAGVSRIYGGGFCTYTEGRFFSHRRQAGCGRQASLIWLGNAA